MTGPSTSAPYLVAKIGQLATAPSDFCPAWRLTNAFSAPQTEALMRIVDPLPP